MSACTRSSHERLKQSSQWPVQALVAYVDETGCCRAHSEESRRGEMRNCLRCDSTLVRMYDCADCAYLAIVDREATPCAAHDGRCIYCGRSECSCTEDFGQ